MSELRTMIRELLLEELGKIGESVPLETSGNHTREEVVTVTSSVELCRFASSVLALARDAEFAKQIEQGRYPFRLSGSPEVVKKANERDSIHSGTRTVPTHFEKGIVTEKDVASLAAEVSQVSCGTSVCLTPLARDALRRREITVVRKSP